MGTQSPEVLVVEDDERLAEVYATHLEADYRVRTATTGTAAIASLDGRLDVIVLDRDLPDLDGRDVLSAVEALGLDVRVLVVTAVAPDFDVLDMGFDEYLEKPVDESELREAVARLLDRADYNDDLREFYRLAATRAILETSKNDAELARSEEYARLCRTMERRREQLRVAAVDLTGRDEFVAIFRDLQRHGRTVTAPTP